VGLGRKETDGADFGKDTERNMRIWERRVSDARARSVREESWADSEKRTGDRRGLRKGRSNIEVNARLL